MATGSIRYPAVLNGTTNSINVTRITGQQGFFVASEGMSREVPGDHASDGRWRDVPDKHQGTVRYIDSCLVSGRCNPMMEMHLHRFDYLSQQCCSFSLQSSGFGVERGVLGKVVSLVGDCRPPPPGNPRRPISPKNRKAGLIGLCARTAHAAMGGFYFPVGNLTFGEVLSAGRMHHSFNNIQKQSNLKELNNPQYFKKNRSYSSCVGRKHVLKFFHFHSHLCGQLVVEPPPIAITNVLETR